ncbi:hypothetical protein J437_LFUL014364 [Ladona fulva]|uniref:PiggyBac transposable element-derived protein domain-containing protein n=1 Tax=Ladona fulva TaxID=123851 RepID=A0A8K0P551_LADFU|nr:hypothetical protein J437_LFUL014364 [Ladona fulva]
MASEPWNIFISNFWEKYNPSESVNADEQLYSKSRYPFIQYMPNKPDKFDIKIWMLANAKTKYFLNAFSYCGNNEDSIHVNNEIFTTKTCRNKLGLILTNQLAKKNKNVSLLSTMHSDVSTSSTPSCNRASFFAFHTAMASAMAVAVKRKNSYLSFPPLVPWESRCHHHHPDNHNNLHQCLSLIQLLSSSEVVEALAQIALVPLEKSYISNVPYSKLAKSRCKKHVATHVLEDININR